MMKHNFMFEDKWNYTLEEVLHSINNQTGGGSIPYEISTFNEVLQACGYFSIIPSSSNPYGLTFLEIDSENIYSPTQLATTFLNKLYLRYSDHYAIQIDEDLSVVSLEFLVYAKKFMKKVFNRLDYTYLKYSLLISNYESQKAHFLDKLERARSGSREVSQEGEHSDTTDNVNLFNDTPQTTDIVATIEGNQYVSELNKGQTSNEGSNSSSGSDEFSESETWDTMTIMARLDEIQKHFSNLWEKWLNEFDELFVEEVNY